MRVRCIKSVTMYGAFGKKSSQSAPNQSFAETRSARAKRRLKMIGQAARTRLNGRNTKLSVRVIKTRIVSNNPHPTKAETINTAQTKEGDFRKR